MVTVGDIRGRDAGIRDRAAAPCSAETVMSVGGHRVDVVFPCLNEEQALPWVLSRLPAGFHAIVVDNGSTDRSAEIARALGATVISEPQRGFGAAAHAGLLAATAPIVTFCDADSSMDPAYLPLLTAGILDGTSDLVLGRRRPTRASAWPVHARIANAALAVLMRRATGIRLHDLGPMRAARREAMLALDLKDRRSGYPLETLLRGKAAGWRVHEVDVPYSPRVGRSKVTGTIRGTITAVRDMSRLLASDRASQRSARQSAGITP